MLNKKLLIAVLFTTAIISGCEKEGPAESAGETLDNAAQKMQEKGKDLGNKIEDACEDVKEGVGAADTDC